ncbi:Pentatricopeptide repeat-containing protein At1g20230, partial [Linum perenne]
MWSLVVLCFRVMHERVMLMKRKSCFCKATKLGLQLNLVSWNGMISGFNHNRQYSDVVLMFRNMHLEGFNPDGTSISSVLPAVRGVEMLCWGIQIHGCIIKQGLGQDNWAVSSLVDMYGKCARPKDMSKVCEEMRDMDVGECNALITRPSRNGCVEDALKMFRQFKVQGLDLNVISWTSMIASCSQNGKDMEALELFRVMQMEGIKPNSATILYLLPACGNIAALMHGKATHCFSLRNVFFYDIYERMKSEGFKKNPCCSWIKIKNKVHMLLAGDKSHPQKPEITKKLAEVRLEMQKSGYLPHTDFVLQDVEEHDEEMVCDHSEKLVVALGLVNTSPGFPLQ